MTDPPFLRARFAWPEPRTMLEEILVGVDLNDREIQVLQGVADGETAHDTGTRLHLSSETVKSYRKRIIAKLGAKNGAHSVAIGLRRELIQ